MTNMNDFKVEVFGTHNGEAPRSPSSLGEVRMELYDSTYNFDELYQAIRKMKHIDRDFQANCQKILTGQDKRWQLWMAIIYTDRVTLDYCREDGSALCCLPFESAKRIGLKFFTTPCINGMVIDREIDCRITRLTKPRAYKLQYEEFHNEKLSDNFTLTHHILPHNA